MFEDITTIRRKNDFVMGSSHDLRRTLDLNVTSNKQLLAKNMFIFGQCMEGTQFYGLFGMVEEISDLAGLSRNNKGLAFVFSMLMFSMAGIPPLAGFFGKYFVFLAAVKAGLYALAIIGVITSVVGAYYYLRVVKIMYFDEPKEAFEPMDGEVKLIAYASGAFTLLFVLPWIASPVIAVAAAAAKSFY
jgi:NADH:ubiquinone oxidoreductase subunit 2 (subunit N)